MKKEDKELLLEDLCARLPYGVKCQVREDEFTYIGTLCRIEVDNKNGNLLDFAESMSGLDCQVYLSEVKPYLFSLSSMTEEQWNNSPSVNLTEFTFDSFKCGCFTIASYTCDNNLHDLVEFINWLIENHFDINGLIEKGLAIDATGKNIY